MGGVSHFSIDLGQETKLSVIAVAPAIFFADSQFKTKSPNEKLVSVEPRFIE